MHIKFGEVQQCDFRVMRVDRQNRHTDRQTYSSQYFAPSEGQSKNIEIGNKRTNINIKQQFIYNVNVDGPKTAKTIKR